MFRLAYLKPLCPSPFPPKLRALSASRLPAFILAPPQTESSPATNSGEPRAALSLWFIRAASQLPRAPSDPTGSSCTAPGRRLRQAPQAPDGILNSGDQIR